MTEGVVLCDKRLININLIRGTKDPSQPPLIGEENYMLQLKNRLRKMKDFDILFKEGKFVGGKLVTLKIWKIEPEKYPRRKYEDDELRVGFVVGLKVSKKAVQRNRIKRQMREVGRLLLKDSKINTGYHMAIVAKPDILDKEYEDMERDINSVLSRAGVL